MNTIKNNKINKLLNEKFVIPENRLKHCYGVAHVMYAVSKYYYKWDENKCQEMYILGLLHDAGYEFVKKGEPTANHAPVLAKILKRQSYPYYKEILNHVTLTTKYKSDELNLLHLADLCVDGDGNVVDFDNRLKELKTRHSSNELTGFNELVNYVNQIYEET